MIGWNVRRGRSSRRIGFSTFEDEGQGGGKEKCRRTRTAHAIVARNDRDRVPALAYPRTYVPLGVYMPVEFVEVERGDDEPAAAAAQYHRGGQELLPRHDDDVDVDGQTVLDDDGGRYRCSDGATLCVVCTRVRRAAAVCVRARAAPSVARTTRGGGQHPSGKGAGAGHRGRP